MLAATPKPCAKCGAAPRRDNVAYCGPCWNAYQSEYRKRRYANEAAYRASAKAKARQSRYGVSGAQYDAMLLDQDGVCAICLEPPSKKGLGVDHNHATGAVRGLLCDHCNGAIGMLRESPDLLARAATYLANFDVT